MSTSRPRLVDTLDLARVESKIDHLIDEMISVRAELDFLRGDLKLRDATTNRIVAALRRTVGLLGRLVRSIHGDGGSRW